ncbi:MAG: hypothetical protein AB7O38_07280 [Pirellulaceae bacterium]
MALRVGLSAYRVEIKNKHARETWRLQRGTQEDGYAEIECYLDSRLNHLVRLGDPNPDTGEYVDNRAVKLIRVEKAQNRRLLAGLYQKGEAGRIQDIHNFDAPDEEPVYTTQRNEGALAPLYFRFHLQDGRPFGIALLQTIGREGLKGYLEDDLRRFFGNAEPELSVKLTQLMDAQVLEAFAQQGKLQDVILINSGKTAESRARMEETTVGGDALGESGDKLALRLHRKGGWRQEVLRRIMQVIQRGEDPRTIVHAPGLDQIDELLVEIEQGGRKQTFSLLNPDDSPIRYDITRSVTWGGNGFPTWDSVHQAANGVWDSVSAIIQ